MTAHRFTSLTAFATLALVAACAQPRELATLSPAADGAIGALERAPTAAGDAIYEGRVYSLDTTRHAPLFRYERRVRDAGTHLVSTHITRDPAGTVVVSQVAEHDAAYLATRATLIQKQSGIVGTVALRNGAREFTLVKRGKTSTRTERATEPLITGPTTVGFIVAHWDALAQGHAIPVRFAVLEMNKSIGFVLERDRQPADTTSGLVTIRMTASNWLMRRFVAPTYFQFEPSTRRVLGYDGRVPPLENVNGKLATLDARVRYTYHVPAFR